MTTLSKEHIVLRLLIETPIRFGVKKYVFRIYPSSKQKKHIPHGHRSHMKRSKNIFFLISTQIYIPGVWFEGGMVVEMTTMKQNIIQCVHCN